MSMNKILVIVQDLRISGTSEGIVSRSFLYRLRETYPMATIDVLYLHTHNIGDEDLEVLPINSLTRKQINIKIPFVVKWVNRVSSRFFNILYAEDYRHKQFANEIAKIKHEDYDFAIVRSSGLNHESILALDKLPILKKSIINFHDPYPYLWYKKEANKIKNADLFRLKKMIGIVSNAKACFTPAAYLAKDLECLYVSNKKFYVIPHQFDDKVFNFSAQTNVRIKEKPVQISYHGALMFGRNIFSFLNAFEKLLIKDKNLKDKVEVVLRVKGEGVNQLKEKYKNNSNVFILDTLNFSDSYTEQKDQSDIVLILENGPHYSNILVGKSPVLEALSKPVLCLAPHESELRNLIKIDTSIANMDNEVEIEEKLSRKIASIIYGNTKENTFGEYFSTSNFIHNFKKIVE